MIEPKKCLYCGVEVSQTPGKRERKFCSPSHTTMWHQKNKKKDKPASKIGRPAGSKNKSTIVIENGKRNSLAEVITTQEQADKFMKDLNEVLDSSGVNEDEMSKYKVKLDVDMADVSWTKWDFSKVVFLNVEDFTEYPKTNCPASGFQRTEYLSKKKESDDKIREAYRMYKQSKD